MWAHTQPTCIHPQTYTHRASHLTPQALDVCGVCIFSHGICFYSFSKPLAAWCVQLHCWFISLPTQQSLISPSGSYTAQHMIALHWGGCWRLFQKREPPLPPFPLHLPPELRETVMGDNNSANCSRLETIGAQMFIWSKNIDFCCELLQNQ